MIMLTGNYKKIFFLLIVIFLLKFAVIGLYDFAIPSEARYASIAMRMELTGNYLMPYIFPELPFFGKPPLSFWASAISFKFLGASDFAGRLPHLLALMALCTMLFVTVKKIYDASTAVVAVLILVSSAVFYTLHSVMTEAFLFLGMNITLLSFILQIESNKPKNIYGYLFFLGCVISTLAKGPVGVAFPGISIFIYLLISKRWKEFFGKFPLIIGSILFLLISIPWFILAQRSYPGFLEYFLIGENFSRFTDPGWKGDRYGNAHRVAWGTIWVFFIGAIFPLIFILLAKGKEIMAEILRQNKKDKNLLFFLISFLVPMTILTFMRNMIATYTIYALVPFVIIMARVLVEKKWERLSLFLAYFTLAVHFIIIILFAIYPVSLAKHINYQSYLVKQIPDYAKNNYNLYFVGSDSSIYSLYSYSQDKLKVLNKENFDSEINKSTASKNYMIIDDDIYKELSDHNKSKLKLMDCVQKKSKCLYEFIK